jgi:NhaP-type Na+/H+ or K+/H+ antiporter
VLFLDAVNLQFQELGKRWLIPFLILGPGTGLITALGAVPIALLLGFTWLVAFMGGAALASTDPVVLREIVRD